MNQLTITVLRTNVCFIGSLLLATSSVFAQISVLIEQRPSTTWITTNAEHVYGLPDVKAGKKGTLTLNAGELTFVSKSSNAAIPRDMIIAVSNGSDRVELWGTTGQVVRMLIPNGGGLAAGAMMHHRVGMLTIDFLDSRGGKHGAVFNMTPAQADAALSTFRMTPAAPLPPAASIACGTKPVGPDSILVLTPRWEAADVPAAYRALVFEHVVTRLKAVKGVGHVYRDGEAIPDDTCPAYTIQISVKTFKLGNQVKRASLGPIGMFVGTTQMVFDFKLKDASGHLDQSEELKTSMRMQSESTSVADMFAKKLAKHYVAALKKEEVASKPPQPTKAGITAFQ